MHCRILLISFTTVWKERKKKQWLNVNVFNASHISLSRQRNMRPKQGPSSAEWEKPHTLHFDMNWCIHTDCFLENRSNLVPEGMKIWTVTYLLQLVGLGLIFVPVSILPVGKTESPNWQDAVNIVSDPGIWLIRAARQETRYWILSHKGQRSHVNY